MLLKFALQILLKHLDKKDTLVPYLTELKAKYGTKVWLNFKNWIIDDFNKV